MERFLINVLRLVVLLNKSIHLEKNLKLRRLNVGEEIFSVEESTYIVANRYPFIIFNRMQYKNRAAAKDKPATDG